MKPIIFSTPMVRAIIDGRKTQTRRVIKLAPGEEECVSAERGEDGTLHISKTAEQGLAYERKINPPYKRGDVLWVRETWNKMPIMPLAGVDIDKPLAHRYIYAADGTIEEAAKLAGLGDEYFVNKSIGWKPSIHLPRAGARLFLKVTDHVRVEKLQDIREPDAIKEGCVYNYAEHYPEVRSAREMFAVLWTAINGKKPHAKWETNPWVWVCEFEMTCLKLEVKA